MNKIILSIVVIFLLPISVNGVEWTVEYEMVQPESTNKFVKVSLPTKFENHDWEIPYLAGRWECRISRYDSSVNIVTENYFYSDVHLMCVLKEKRDVTIDASIGCDNGYISDTKENRLIVSLFGGEGGGYKELKQITLECKL